MLKDAQDHHGEFSADTDHVYVGGAVSVLRCFDHVVCWPQEQRDPLWMDIEEREQKADKAKAAAGAGAGAGSGSGSSSAAASSKGKPAAAESKSAKGGKRAEAASDDEADESQQLSDGRDPAVDLVLAERERGLTRLQVCAEQLPLCCVLCCAAASALSLVPRAALQALIDAGAWKNLPSTAKTYK